MKTKTRRNLLTLIENNKYDWVSPNITEENFPPQLESNTESRLFYFGKNITSEEAITEINKEGFSPANLYELLAWKDWNGTDTVIALGSVAKGRGSRRVPGLWRYGSERDLDLFWFGSGWLDVCRFLAFRKISDSENVGAKPFDTLNLGRLEKLEDFAREVRVASDKLNG